MTLRYLIFGNPQNKSEFDDMLLRREIKSIDISIGEIFGDYDMRQGLKHGFYGCSYSCFPILDAGNKKLRPLNRSIDAFVNPTSRDGIKDILEVRKRVVDDAVGIARDYERRGLKVTMAGREIEEAIEEFEQYHRDELRRLYNP